MSEIVAAVAKLYLYPVKSMAGIPLEEAHVGLDGIVGDRQYAFVLADRAGTKSFPWMTARQDSRMLCYEASFDHLPTAENREPVLRVCTPEGRVFHVSDDSLREELEGKFGRRLFLLKSERGIFDCQHISLFNLASVRSLAAEADCKIDHRQFRANLYFEPVSGRPFDEELWIDCLLGIGDRVLTSVAQRDPRCMMVNIDPQSGISNPQVLKSIAQNHAGQAGLYLNVIRTGTIKLGDTVRKIAIPV